MKPNLSVDIGGIELKNPVMTASGTFGYGPEFADYLDLNSLGGIITKGLSLKPRAGNPTPRIVETCGGMLNAIGLQNVGIDEFISQKGPLLPDHLHQGHRQLLRDHRGGVRRTGGATGRQSPRWPGLR